MTREGLNFFPDNFRAIQKLIIAASAVHLLISASLVMSQAGIIIPGRGILADGCQRVGLGKTVIRLLIITLITGDESEQVKSLGTTGIYTQRTPSQSSTMRPIPGGACTGRLLQRRVSFIRFHIFTVAHSTGSQVIHDFFRELFTGIKYLHVSMGIHIHTLGVISAVQLITMAIHCHHGMQSRSGCTSALVFTITITMPVRGRRRVAHINIGQSDARVPMMTERIKTTLANFQAEGFRQSRTIATFTVAMHTQCRPSAKIYLSRADCCHLNLYPAGTQKKCHGRHYCHANSPFHMLCYNICDAVCKYFQPPTPYFCPRFHHFFPFFKTIRPAHSRKSHPIISQNHYTLTINTLHFSAFI